MRLLLLNNRWASVLCVLCKAFSIVLLEGFLISPPCSCPPKDSPSKRSRGMKNPTSLEMFDQQDDPELLLEMVQDLLLEDSSPQSLAEMESVEAALTKFLEERPWMDEEDDDENPPQDIYEAELEGLLKPPPPRIPPPGELLETNSQIEHWNQQEKELIQALESLRERLWQDESFDEDDKDAWDEDDFNDALEGDEDAWGDEFSENDEILRQAEEALQKSRKAAELRKAEANRRSFTAAKAYSTRAESKIPPFEKNPQDYKRPTIQLGDLLGEDPSKNRSEDHFGIPVLYDWTQDDGGAITGKIKKSIQFDDGATISTSSVRQIARGGTVVTTASGSRYYLEVRKEDANALEDDFETQIASESIFTILGESSRTKAPSGVPTVKSWEVRQNGGIIGLIYGSRDADDGDYIETSPIVEGDIDNFSVVATESGNRYFLSGDPPDNTLDSLFAFRDEIIGSSPRKKNNNNIFVRTRSRSDIKKSSSGPRPTFSLFDLFAGDKSGDRNESPVPPLPPPSDKIPPVGTPTLTEYVFNDDGSITGYIFGSSIIEDGRLITTSPIMGGERRQFETVITATGSLYFLG